MNRQERQKAKERFYFEHFRKLAGWTQAFHPSEEPDFLSTPQPCELGVEVTQLFKDSGPSGSTMMACEVSRSQLLERLAKEYYSKGGLPAYVKAIMPDTSISDKLSKVVQLLIYQRPSVPGKDKRFVYRIQPGLDVTFFIQGLPDDFGNYALWQCISNSVGFVGHVTSEMLSRVISEKARKLPQYLKRAREVALLIYIEGTKASGMLDAPKYLNELSSQGFKEVHLLIYPLQILRIA